MGQVEEPMSERPTHDDKCERCGECLGCCWPSVSAGYKAYTWCIVRDGPRRKHRWPEAQD